MDGKALRGMCQKEETRREHLLSVYDVEQGKTMAQVEVGRNENEFPKAPEVLKLTEISQKVLTADVLHTQKRLSQHILDENSDFLFPVKDYQARLYQNIQALFAQCIPSQDSEKSRLIF